MTLEVWQHIRQEAKELAECEPMLASFFHSTILKHQNLGSALSYLLANKLANPIMPAISLREIIEEAYQAEPNIIDCAACDIKAVRHRDPAVELWSTPLLYLKLSHYPLFVEPKSKSTRALFTKSNFSGFRCRYSSCRQNWARHYV